MRISPEKLFSQMNSIIGGGEKITHIRHRMGNRWYRHGFRVALICQVKTVIFRFVENFFIHRFSCMESILINHEIIGEMEILAKNCRRRWLKTQIEVSNWSMDENFISAVQSQSKLLMLHQLRMNLIQITRARMLMTCYLVCEWYLHSFPSLYPTLIICHLPNFVQFENAEFPNVCWHLLTSERSNGRIAKNIFFYPFWKDFFLAFFRSRKKFLSAREKSIKSGKTHGNTQARAKLHHHNFSRLERCKRGWTERDKSIYDGGNFLVVVFVKIFRLTVTSFPPFSLNFSCGCEERKKGKKV